MNKTLVLANLECAIIVAPARTVALAAAKAGPRRAKKTPNSNLDLGAPAFIGRSFLIVFFF